MSDEKSMDDPLNYISVEQWEQLGENMEPDWDKAHKPRLKTEVITIRLGEADIQRLKTLAEHMGVGHSTLARMILRKALQQGSNAGEEAVTSAVDERPSVRVR